jgi:hypothetical protein
VDSALAAAGDNHEIIFTDRLDDTQRQVEKVLLANGIEPAPAKEAGISSKKAPAANENVYSQNRPAAGQVQYEVFVTPEQMTRVQEGIHGLRARQNVSQELAFGAADGTEGTRRRGQASYSFGKAPGAPPAAAGKYGLADKAQDGAKAPQTKPTDPAGAGRAVATAEQGEALKEVVTVAAPAAAAPTTAPLAPAKSEAGDAQWAMNVDKKDKKEALLDPRKETAEKEQAAETAKRMSPSPVEPAAEERMAERTDRKLDERPAAKPAGEPVVMAKPSSVAAPAARPTPLPGKEMPSRAADEKVAPEEVAHKAEQPASQPAADSYGGGRLVANAPAGGAAKVGKDMKGWKDPARGNDLGITQSRVQPPVAPAATAPTAPATSPAAAGDEAVVEVKVLHGHGASPLKQPHELAVTGGAMVAGNGARQQPAPAATQPSQAQALSPAGQGGPANQLVTQQRLGEAQKAESEWKAQGDSSPPAPAETQANQADQPVAAQAAVATQGKFNQRAPTGQVQEVSRSGLANQQLRQAASQSAAARVQRLLITVNFRSDSQAAEPPTRAASKAQTQDQRPDTKE